MAAHLAGKAINISKTTASHALSYEIAARLGIQHGHAVALTLGKIFEYNASVTEETCSDSRGTKYVLDIINELVLLMGCSSAREAEKFIENLINDWYIVREERKNRMQEIVNIAQEKAEVKKGE